jgi:hypothetical protein
MLQLGIETPTLDQQSLKAQCRFRLSTELEKITDPVVKAVLASKPNQRASLVNKVDPRTARWPHLPELAG